MSTDSPKLKPSEQAALNSILELIGDAETLDEKTWRTAAQDDARISAADKPDSRRRVIAEAMRGLAREDLVQVQGGQIHMVNSGGDIDFDDFKEGDDDGTD